MSPARPEAGRSVERRDPHEGDYATPEFLLADELRRVPAGARSRRRWSDSAWIALTIVGLTAFSLELAGARGPLLHRLEDGLHLFSSGFPGRPSPGTPVAVEIAQQLAPLVVLFLTLKLVTAVFRRQLHQARARVRRGHAVVCGLDDKGFRIAEGFLDAGRRVSCLAPSPAQDLVEHLRGRGAIVIDGDPTQEKSLRTVAAQQARYVVCSSTLDRDNATTAAVISALVDDRRQTPIEIFAHIGEPELASLLRSATLGRGRVRVQFFDLSAIWAHELLNAGPDLGSSPAIAPQLVVVGTTPIAQALVVEATRRWYDTASSETPKLRVTLAGVDAERVCARLRERYPALAQRSELVSVAKDVSIESPVDLRELFSAPDQRRDALFLCAPDEGESLGLALQASREFEGAGPRIVVPATLWTFRLGSLLGRAADDITPVFYSSRPTSLDLLHDSALESIARAVHSSYVEGRRGAEDFGRRPGDVPWHALAEQYREATRRNVDELVSQLNALWYELAPRYDWGEALIELTAEQIDTLARLEHERWCRDRVAEGWGYGPVDDEKRSPRLRAWDELPEETKAINRVLVEQRPRILAHAGFRLVRSPDRVRLARLLHERLLESRRTAEGEADPTLVDWESLDPEARELNLSAVDAIAVDLLGIGYRMVDDTTGSPLRLDPAQVEQLAENEHERWCSTRLAQGWRHGTARDERLRLHPDLVPWSELGEARRQIDRDQVAALPQLLTAAGRRVLPLVAA